MIADDAGFVPSSIVWGATEQTELEQYLARIAARIAAPTRTGADGLVA